MKPGWIWHSNASIILSKPFQELKLLGDLVFAYEQKRRPVEAPDPIDLLIPKLEDGEIARERLNHLFTSRAQKFLVLHKKRRGSAATMYKMVKDFGIPADSFFTTGYFESFRPTKP